MTASQGSARVLPFGVASALACAAALGLAVLAPEPSRTAAVYGAVAASLGAVCALSALAAVASRSTSGVLTAFSIGFLCRMVLVAVGLIASGARGTSALVYVGVFFAVYAITQAIEILFVHRSTRPRATGDAP